MRTVRRILLVGFMASGKTEVGRRLATRLGWLHVDLDREIERETGRRIEEIFALEGEAAFRGLEREITPAFVSREDVVISTGGGWITNQGLFDALPQDTLTVWLKVSPAEVVRRVQTGAGQSVRPLLRSPDPRRTVEMLLSTREPLYATAEIAVETDDRQPEEIAAQLERIVRTRLDQQIPPDQSRS